MSQLHNLVWVAVLALPLILIGIGAQIAGADRRGRHFNGEGRDRG